MSYHAYLYLLLASEIYMIVHLTRNKSVGTRLHGIVEQKVSCSAAYCHAAHRAFQQLVAHGTVRSELFFHICHKVRCILRLRQFANDSASGLNATDNLTCEEIHIFKSHLLRNPKVHSAACIIKIRMCGIHCDMVFNSLDNAAFHCVASGNALQPVEKQRVMRHNEIRPAGNGFINHRLGYVQTQ